MSALCRQNTLFYLSYRVMECQRVSTGVHCFSSTFQRLRKSVSAIKGLEKPLYKTFNQRVRGSSPRALTILNQCVTSFGRVPPTGSAAFRRAGEPQERARRQKIGRPGALYSFGSTVA